MTAFSSRQGSADIASWSWDLRSVNGRGLDLRLRLPDGVDGLEIAIRKALGAGLARGNVTLGLKLSREGGDGAVRLDPDHLDRVLDALDEVQTRAMEKGVTLMQPTAADVMAQKGVLAYGSDDTDLATLLKPLLEDFDALLQDFIAMREREGAALAGLMNAQLSEIEALITEAATVAAKRADITRQNLRKALERITDEGAPVEEDRLAQELALIAVKADITEELDRLSAHVAAGRQLLDEGGPVGRKLDFLSQEFNREANTLCSKAQDKDLTRIGLALKVVIDQMREQTQNVE